MADELNAGKVLFPRRLFPAAGHTLIGNMDPERMGNLLTQRLYLYFDFTRALEQEIVNPVLAMISKGSTGVPLTPVMRVDAHRIYVDEAYHALTAVDLNLQIERATGIRYEAYTLHRFQRALLQRVKDASGVVDPHLVELCAATVSETLISGSLALIPADDSVASVIREAVAEHADDERCHHAYFSKLHEAVWPRLPADVRRRLAPLFGDFILEFLLPDRHALQELLVRSGVSKRTSATVIHDSYDELDSSTEVRRAARATMALLARTGVLQEAGAEDHYAALGLLTN